jgi:acid phosphatase family membrane protein YuiD
MGTTNKKDTKLERATLPTKKEIKKQQKRQHNSSSWHEKSVHWKNAEVKQLYAHHPVNALFGIQQGVTSLSTNGYFSNAPVLQ